VTRPQLTNFWFGLFGLNQLAGFSPPLTTTVNCLNSGDDNCCKKITNDNGMKTTTIYLLPRKVTLPITLEV
jgi:hypothetical protein